MRRLARAQPFGTALGPEGFGANVTGGTGGTVFNVTNINDSGVGSLRQALADADANSPNPSIVNILVGGIITANSLMDINGDNITVTGKNAPAPFLIRGTAAWNGVLFAVGGNSSNIIIEHLRLYRGIGSISGSDTTRPFSIFGSNVLVRHCSFAWSTDELVVNWISNTLTYDYCLFYEPLAASHHWEGGGLQNHPMGVNFNNPGPDLAYQVRASMLRSCMVHMEERVPQVVLADTEFVNVIAYNWGNPNNGGRIIDTTGGSALPSNFIGCYYMQGVDTEIASKPIHGASEHTVVYINDCIWQKRDFTQDRAAANFIRSGNPKATPNVWTPATPKNPTALPVDEVWQHLRPRVGAILPRRSASDIRILKHIDNAYKKISLDGEIIDSPTLFDHNNVNTNPNRAKHTGHADWPDAL